MTWGSAPRWRRASWRPIDGTPRACCGRRTGWWKAPTAPGSWTRARAFSDMRRRPSHRPERVAEAIRQTVAEFLTGNVRDPRVGFVTVTAVEVSADLSHARVRVSVMGNEEEKAQSLEGLASAAWSKSYQGVIRFGTVTSTDDATGEPVATSDAWRGADAAQVERVLATFRGAYDQRPPAYSAVKVAGVRAYRRARRCEVVALPARRVEIAELALVRFAPPDL